MNINTDIYSFSTMFNGICIVHALYDGKENDFINSTEINKIKNTNIFLHDFNNFLPGAHRIAHGSGYIRTIGTEQYIITCNHIMIKYAKYSGYCYDIKNNPVCLSLTVYKRITELDIVIMKILTVLDHPLAELDISIDINEKYDKKLENKIISGSFLSNQMEFTDININTDIDIIFELLISDYMNDIPLLNMSVNEIDYIKKNIEEYKLKNPEHDKNSIEFRKHVYNLAINKYSGLSGSIIRTGNKNIGMIFICTNDKEGVFLKGIPLFIIDKIVSNSINCIELSGIQINTCNCEIDYEDKKLNAQYVLGRATFKNGLKTFYFNEGDIIISVNEKKFNENNLLWCNFLKMNVPLNTYLMLKSIMCIDNKHKPILIKTGKISLDKFNVRVFNISPIPYNQMYHFTITTNYYRWKDLVFIELSEELDRFYSRQGINLTNYRQFNNTNSNNKNVILFNYNKKLNDNNLSKQYYISMPYNGTTGNYFYSVKSISKHKINNINDIINVLKSSTEQQIKLKNDINETTILTI